MLLNNETLKANKKLGITSATVLKHIKTLK